MLRGLLGDRQEFEISFSAMENERTSIMAACDVTNHSPTVGNAFRLGN
jgi:hypothetical protein